MKRFVILSLALLMLFCSCSKKQDDGFDLLVISDVTALSILDALTYDILPYSRDDADVESLIEELNAVPITGVKVAEYIDYKDDTPCVTLFLDESTYSTIFKVWSLGGGECAATQYVVGSEQVLYSFSFNSEKVAKLTEKIYNDFRG